MEAREITLGYLRFLLRRAATLVFIALLTTTATQRLVGGVGINVDLHVSRSMKGPRVGSSTSAERRVK